MRGITSVIRVYYKVRLVLQSATGITKCDSYYKVRRNTWFQNLVLRFFDSFQLQLIKTF